MLNRLYSGFWFYLLSLFCFGAAHAQSHSVVDCSGCTELWQFEEAVRYMPDGEHHVIDRNSWTAKSFYVSGWGEAPVEFGSPNVTVTQLNPPGDLLEALDGYAEMEAVTGGTMRLMVDVNLGDLNVPDVPVGVTAFEIATNSTIRTRIADRLDQGLPGFAPNLKGLIELTATGAGGWFGLRGYGYMNITVHTADGNVTYQYVIGDRKVTYLKGHSRTGNNELINEDLFGDISQVSFEAGGTYYISQVDKQLQDLGVPMQDFGFGASPTRITCTVVQRPGGEGFIQRCERWFY